MPHDLLAEPAECAECRVLYHDWAEMRAKDSPKPSFEQWEAASVKLGYQHPHTAYQDNAIAQAVRAAAGSENPVAWVLWSDENISANLDFRWHNIANELRKLVNPTGGKA